MINDREKVASSTVLAGDLRSRANQSRFAYYEKTVGFDGPGDGDDYTLVHRQKTHRRAVETYGHYYSSIDNEHVDLHDAVGLLVFLEEGYALDERTGPLFDQLLLVEQERLLNELQTPQRRDLDSYNREQRYGSLKQYFQAPREQRWDTYYFGDPIEKEFIKKSVRQYVEEYLLPLRMWMPEIPYAHYDRDRPQEVLDMLDKATGDGRYPLDRMVEVHEDRSLFGEQHVKVLGVLSPWGAKTNQNGVLLRYDSLKSVPLEVIEDGMATYGYYFAEVTNGKERSPRDCFHLVNFGTLLMTSAQVVDPEKRNTYYQAAKKAFAIARKVAMVGLDTGAQEKFNRHVLPQEGEATLQVALTQLYDRDKLHETETLLKEALSLFETYLRHSPADDSVNRLKAWTQYHLGVYYQDVRHDADRATEFLTQAFDALKASQLPKGSIEGRLGRARGVITIRTPSGMKDVRVMDHLHALTLIEAASQQGVVRYYESISLQYVNVPELVGITGACENIDTLFKVRSRTGVPLFMTQTGQLSLEQALQVHRQGVYTVIHSGRDEEEEDARHLRQFCLIEEEFGSTLAGMSRENYDEEAMFEALLVHIEAATKSMIRVALNEQADVLKNVYGRDVDELREVAAHPYLRITYEDALGLLNQHGYPELLWGSDLKAEHEQAVVTILNQQDRVSQTTVTRADLPVFIMRYPKEIKFFNMKVSSRDPRIVLSADLILPIAGEATGAAVREHDGSKLRQRLLSSKMFELHEARGGSIADFEWYLRIIDNEETDPHAGYGIGNERVIQFILGQPDIRTCSVIRIMGEQTGEWQMREALPFVAL